MSEFLLGASANGTPNFNLEKITENDEYGYDKFNNNMEAIDEEMVKPPLTVNQVEPDANRDIQITTVPLADNLTSDEAQINIGTFVIRTSGGDASISDGGAWLSEIRGDQVKTGYVPESISISVVGDIVAVVDRNTFVSEVTASDTIVLTYTTEWSENPATYGITVTGTPEDGDSITIVYVKENRGTITVVNPTTFISTGWNLYNHTAGYARVINYSSEYGFMIDGTYTTLEFAETLAGQRTTITPVDGFFTVPSDGYVFVTGGNDTDTAIWMTWSDWTDEANGGVFEPYSQTMIDLSGLMVSFPDGLMRIGNVYDEINLNTQRAYSRIQKLEYTAENLEDVIDSGVPYDTDTNYIYAVRETPVTLIISLSGEYTVSDHGIEMFNGTTVPLTVYALYGQDLKGKLRRDVLMLSQQTLTEAQKAQVRENINAAKAYDSGTKRINYGSHSYIMYRKINNVVHVHVTLYQTDTGNKTAWQGVTIGNIPAGYRPLWEVFSRPCIDRSEATMASIAISTSGNVAFNPRSGSFESNTDIIYADLVYITT